MLELLQDPFFMDAVDYELLEGAGYDNRFVVRGKFQQTDEANINGRRYSRNLWESVINDPVHKSRMSERFMYGEADHPGDGRTQIKRVSHIVTGLNIRPNGEVIGEAEILRTPNGNILRSLYESKCKVGVSSRGRGRVNPSTNYVDESCYKYDTFDMVAQPSTRGAYAAPVGVPGGGSSRQAIRRPAAVLKNASAFLESALQETFDPALRIERLCECLDHEQNLSIVQSENDKLIPVCEELLSGLSSVRSGLEESLSVYEVNTKSNGDTPMSNQTPQMVLTESASHAITEAAVLNERLASLEESHTALMESYEDLQVQYDATRRLLEASARTAENLAMENRSLDEDLQSALHTVDVLATHIEESEEGDSEDPDLEESGYNGQFVMGLEEAAAVLLETMVEQNANLRLVNESLVTKTASAKSLTEAALNRYGSLLFESGINSILGRHPDQEFAESYLRPRLENAETLDEAEEIYDSTMQLIESVSSQRVGARSPYGFFHDHAEPLPHQQSNQVLTESAMPTQPQDPGLQEMKMLTESILSTSGLK